MDLQPLIPWLSAIALIMTLANTIFTLLTSSSKANADKITAIEKAFAGKVASMDKTLIDHDRRIQEVEADFRHLPDKDAVHRLELSLKDLQSEMVKINASAEQSARTSARVEAYLLEKG